jgi:predicted metal-dependent phosphoesterase TrpH
MISYDLHSHTIASDGTLSPSELVARASAAGVNVLAITDHDTTEGLAEAREAAQHLDMGFVNGCEISVTWSNITVHILGLNLDADNPALQQGLKKLRDHRHDRALEIGSKLEKAGINGAYKGAARFAKGSLISRTHFAHFLAETGYARDVRSVFKKFLVKGKPGFVAGKWAGLAEVVEWITQAGGQAVIAHPARYSLTRTKLIRLIDEFKQAGGTGIEVVSGSHNRDECFTMAKHAREFGLLASAGSDFHGPENPWIELGRLPDLPPGCEPIWNSWS